MSAEKNDSSKSDCDDVAAASTTMGKTRTLIHMRLMKTSKRAMKDMMNIATHRIRIPSKTLMWMKTTSAKKRSNTRMLKIT